jgi:hypothetical protein
VKRIAVFLVLALGCHKEGAGGQADSGPAAAAPEAVDGGFVLTAEQLDAYLRYQKAAAAPLASPDGGALDRAARDEAALKQVGLTDVQVTRIDEMVSTVVARRMVTQLAANPEFMPDMAAMGQALNAEQKKRMDEAMAAFKQQQQQAKELTEERKRFGSKNIDVLLTREVEVTKAWSEMMGLTQSPGR